MKKTVSLKFHTIFLKSSYGLYIESRKRKAEALNETSKRS